VLGTLRAPAGEETQEQIRRVRSGALDFYKTGWQSLLSSSAQITWRDSELDPNPPTWELRAGESRQLQTVRTTYQAGPIIASACGALLMGFVLFGAFWAIARRNRRRAMQM